MIRNTQSSRAFTAFLVTWSFVLLTVTGLVLYVVPQGRIANWLDWSLAGLTKGGWSDVHILFGGIFIVAGAVHLYFNWKPFRNYLAKRAQGHLEVKRELVTSLAATVALTVGAIANVPPVSWVFELNDDIKAYWAQGPGQEPPFGHAEEVPLPTLAKRVGFDLDGALTTWRGQGLRVDDEPATLRQIAIANGITPAAVYALILPPAPRPAATTGVPLDPMQVEERLAGSGIGGRSVAGFAREQGLATDQALARLNAVGVAATVTDRLKTIAEGAGTKPIEIAKSLLIEGYRPAPAE